MKFISIEKLLLNSEYEELRNLMRHFLMLSIKLHRASNGKLLIDKERDPFDNLIIEFYESLSASELIKNEIFMGNLKKRVSELQIYDDEVHKHREPIP